jgi:hypothetical protein
MLQNYIRVALRNFKHNKFYSFLNILGLAVGSALFIALLTISAQVFRAAISNPVDALRYE